MAWLVDGFNLLHTVTDWAKRLDGKGPAVVTRELAHELARWSALLPAGQRVLLVLDGGPGNLDPMPGAPGLTVRFRSHADALILEELRRSDQRHTLVSRDRELVDAARKGGYHDAIEPGVFWSRVRGDLAANAEEVERQRTPDAEEVKAWAALFRGAKPREGPPVKEPAPKKPTAPAAPEPAPSRTPAPSPPAKAARAWPPPAHEDRARGRALSPDEVKEWLDWFNEPRSS